jgi:hypothetical protein
VSTPVPADDEVLVKGFATTLNSGDSGSRPRSRCVSVSGLADD